jgi:hypothetical protein
MENDEASRYDIEPGDSTQPLMLFKSQICALDAFDYVGKAKNSIIKFGNSIKSEIIRLGVGETVAEGALNALRAKLRENIGEPLYSLISE